MQQPTDSNVNQPSDSIDPLISTMQDDEAFLDLIVFFVTGLREKLKELDTLLGQDRLDDLARLAHQLKGAAGGYGFPSISEFAKDVEQLAQSGESTPELKTSVEQLAKLCERACAGISR